MKRLMLIAVGLLMALATTLCFAQFTYTVTPQGTITTYSPPGSDFSYSTGPNGRSYTTYTPPGSGYAYSTGRDGGQYTTFTPQGSSFSYGTGPRGKGFTIYNPGGTFNYLTPNR